MRNTLDVIEQFTNQYVLVYKLSIYKDKEYIMESSDGLSAIDIANLIIVACKDTLPVNIITNTLILSSILKYVVSNYIPVRQFPLRDHKCMENKKGNPKVIIWNLFFRKEPKRLLNYLDIANFTQKNNNKIKFYKKHVFLNEVLDHIKLAAINPPQDRVDSSPIIYERYGRMDCNDQGTIDCGIQLYVSLDPKENLNISDSLAFLQKKKFAAIFCK